MQQRRISILGSTGSIGTQTLDVVRQQDGFLEVVALSARGSNLELLEQQIREFKPELVHVSSQEAASSLRLRLGAEDPEIIEGHEGLIRVAAEPYCNTVVVATVGWVGVEPTLAAIEAGREIALANKEVLVCAGDLITSAAEKASVAILPLDSEHNAIAQCLLAGPSEPQAPLRRLILTCSGGAYRTATLEEIACGNRARTLNHPTWDMGSKITVDSATLMNKGFEVIEAHHLFGVPYNKIEVIIHPQSTIHSMVEFVDGSMIAQMGHTDMRLPIQNVLTHPFRRPVPLEALDLAKVRNLEFFEPDLDRFPALAMAYEAGREGGSVPCVLNAANEVAVQAHLEDRIPCGAIARVVRFALDRTEKHANPSLPDLKQIDRHARDLASEGIEQLLRNSA